MRIKMNIPDWVIGLAVTLFFLGIVGTGIFDFTEPLEIKTFDLRAQMAATRERNPDIELVVISEEDLEELGRFPWSRDIIAQGIHNLALAGARVIALNLPLTESEKNAGLKALHDLKDRYEELGLAQEGPGLTFLKILSQAVVALDNDTKLYRAMKEAGNVVLPVFFDTENKGADAGPPPFILHHSLKEVNEPEGKGSASPMIRFSKIKPLLPAFTEVAAGIGHFNFFPDPDGMIRNQTPVVRYLKDYYLPSFAVTIVRVFKNLKDEHLTISPGLGLQIKTGPSSLLRVPAQGPGMPTPIVWSKGPGVSFHQTPYGKVYKNEFQTSLFRDKIVLIGPAGQDLESPLATPISEDLPAIEVAANCIANILQQRFMSRPDWGPILEALVLLLCGFFVSFLLPRMRTITGVSFTFVFLALYGCFGTWLFFSYQLWVKITAPMLLLAAGCILILCKRAFIQKKTREWVEADSIETNKMLGLSFQQQGMLDLAFDKFHKLPIEGKGVKELLYKLGLDFEGKRQFSKALSAYELILRDGEKPFKDLADRIPKLKKAEATLVLGEADRPHQEISENARGDLETPSALGRYEIVDELGRGAMGVVYKGQDPKIHRTVAIKTIQLSHFDEDIVGEIKERFFREAESAGLLAHPNIVTIYDCGEESDLAYIAMEYLEGGSLEAFTRKGKLLPIRESLSIVADVANALDYAHEKGIVHRDIKPANIMRLNDSGTVKVTDFGIARITSSSKTKTGIILGTPSYMSPEQIAGKRVDGRSDIYSLGIVLFEMLTGQKPFMGKDMTSLMYKIAREHHPSARSINSMVPPVVEKIIDKALEKDVKSRYQRAAHMAAHLSRVVTRMDELVARRKAQSKV